MDNHRDIRVLNRKKMISIRSNPEYVYVVQYKNYPYMVLTLGLSYYIPLFLSKLIVLLEIMFIFNDRNHFGRAFVALLCSRIIQIDHWIYLTLAVNYLFFIGLSVLFEIYPNVHNIYIPIWIVYKLNSGFTWQQHLWNYLNVCAIFGTLFRTMMIFAMYNYLDSQVPNWTMLGYFLTILSVNGASTNTFIEEIPVWSETIIMGMLLVKLVYHLVLVVLFLVH